MMHERGTTATRRELIPGGVAAGLIGVARATSAQAGRVRPDLASAAGTKMLGLYPSAGKAMQDPAINSPPQPQSWIFQAYIHGVPANPFDPANSGGFYNG